MQAQKDNRRVADRTAPEGSMLPAAVPAIIPSITLSGKLEDYFLPDGAADMNRLAEELTRIPDLLPSGVQATSAIFSRISASDRMYASVDRFESQAGPMVVKFCDLSALPFEIAGPDLQLDSEALKIAAEKKIPGLTSALFLLEAEHEGGKVCLGIISRFEHISRTYAEIRKKGTPDEKAEAQKAILSIIEGFNAHEWYLWDCEPNNFVQLADNSWKLIDPGSITGTFERTDGPTLQKRALTTLFDW